LPRFRPAKIEIARPPAQAYLSAAAPDIPAAKCREIGNDGFCNLRNLRIYLREMRKPILDTLFPKTRQALLSALLLRPDKWWYLSDLARHLGVPPSSLQRELASLVSGDVVARREDGSRVYYRAKEDCPIIGELQAILVKTAGIADVIRAGFEKVRGKVDIAFIYGSVARAQQLSVSDVDVMVIGEVQLGDLVPGLRRAEKALGREVNATIYSREEFARRLKKKDALLKTVLADARIFLKGNENELEALGR